MRTNVYVFLCSYLYILIQRCSLHMPSNHTCTVHPVISSPPTPCHMKPHPNRQRRRYVKSQILVEDPVDPTTLTHEGTSVARQPHTAQARRLQAMFRKDVPGGAQSG